MCRIECMDVPPNIYSFGHPRYNNVNIRLSSIPISVVHYETWKNLTRPPDNIYSPWKIRVILFLPDSLWLTVQVVCGTNGSGQNPECDRTTTFRNGFAAIITIRRFRIDSTINPVPLPLHRRKKEILRSRFHLPPCDHWIRRSGTLPSRFYSYSSKNKGGTGQYSAD